MERYFRRARGIVAEPDLSLPSFTDDSTFVTIPGGYKIPNYRSLSNIALSQRGLFASVHKFGAFIVIKQNAINCPQKLDQLLELYRKIYNHNFEVNTRGAGDKFRTRILFGVDPKLWKDFKFPDGKYEMRPEGPNLVKGSTRFMNTGGDAFIYIKSDRKENVDTIVHELSIAMIDSGFKEDEFATQMSNEFGNTKIIHGSFREGLANPVNYEQVNQNIVTGSSGKGQPGGAYMFTQKFKMDWNKLQSRTLMSRENMIGRKMFCLSIIPGSDESSHVRRAHRMDSFPNPTNVVESLARIFRQSMPYGEIPGFPGREEGVFHVSIAQSMSIFNRILESMAGKAEDSTMDGLLEMLEAVEGSYWYVPNTEELDIHPKPEGICRVDIEEQWNIPLLNKYMFLNHRQYLHLVDMKKYIPGDKPSARVVRLLQYTFELWNHHWFEKAEVPDFPALQDVALTAQEEAMLEDSIPIRRGLAIKKMLGTLVTTEDIDGKIKKPHELYGWRAGLFDIHPDEIIVGHVQKSTGLGLGKKTMSYLNDEEKERLFLMGLSEVSSVGHVIPDHSRLLRHGISGLLSIVKDEGEKSENATECAFYKSVQLALEGVQMYVNNYSRLANYLSKQTGEYNEHKLTNFRTIAERMQFLSGPMGVPRNFIEAVQLIYSMHCCLHITGEPVSVGRLDVLLAGFIDKTKLENDVYMWECQKAIDCFWVKFSERVLLDPHFASDNTEWGNCAVPFSSDGTFPRGDSINQWVQQVTVGGYYDNTVDERCAKAITLLCLRAARRLPLIAPCLSLRVHQDMDDDLLREAAKALLSGSAHPILPHDDRIIKALKNSPYISSENPHAVISEHDVAEYACDGCYEPLIAGKSQFAFTYIPLPKILEMSMNEGRSYAQAGPAFLLGNPSSYRSQPATEIHNFDDLREIFMKHLKLQTDSAMCKLLQNYGNIWKACPAPLLSSVIDGCIETGRDFYNGGAKYSIASCMYIGFANCVDSLFAIDKLCFNKKTACVPLAELLTALQNDWGFDVEEMVTDNNVDEMRIKEKRTYYQSLRQRALDLPKFGTDKGAEDADLQEIATWLSDIVVSKFKSSVQAESGPFYDIINGLKKKFAPFEILFCPGSGTFEGYVGWGLSLGASADGRRKFMPIASDISASPSIQDGSIVEVDNNIYKSLRCWDINSMKYEFSIGAEVDLNIHEDFPEDGLFEFLQNYSNEKENIGANLLTLTCADRERYEEAMKDPEKYDLLRVRMGGWTEHFVTMFDSHKKQHARRPYYKLPSQTPRR